MNIESFVGKTVATIEVVKALPHQVSYETAAWYRTLKSDIGSFPMRLAKSRKGVYLLVVDLPATVTGNDTSSLCGGVRVGKRNTDSDVGVRESFAKSFLLKQAISEFSIALHPEFVETAVRFVDQSLRDNIQGNVSWMAERAGNLHVPTNWENKTVGYYRSFRSGSFRFHADWIAEDSELLRKLQYPTPTDRHETIEDIVEAWHTKYRKNVELWGRNRVSRKTHESLGTINYPMAQKEEA